jgi:multidrug efflux pump subunit AcrB
VIPVTVLITLVAMKAAGLSFNLMTLGGIAAAIGLVIDDAIVVVGAIYAKVASGLAASRRSGWRSPRSCILSSARHSPRWSCSFPWPSSTGSRASSSAPSP